jgi:hypothetical protein
MTRLCLETRDYNGPLEWRWLLSEEASGVPLADHRVALDRGGEDYQAFTGLYRYLRWHGVPDRRAASEAEITARVGAWAEVHVLGEGVGAAIAGAAPCMVRVVVPAQAGFVLGGR